MGQGRRPTRPMTRCGLVALAVVVAVLVLAPAALADGGVAPLWSTTWNAKTPGVVTNVQVARTPFGEVYTACSILRPTTGKYDVIVARYRADGTRVWVHSWSRGTAYDDWVEAISSDPDGRLVVCGWTDSGKGGTPDWFVLKYGRNGTLLWTKTVGGSFGGEDKAVDLAVNARSYIFVTGYITQSTGGTDWRTMKITPKGATSLSLSYKGADKLDDKPSAIAIDVDRNVYVTGMEGTADHVRSDAVTVQYTKDGVRNWVAKYNDKGEDAGVDVAVRRSGVVVAVATIDQDAVATRATALQYTRAGEPVWAAPLDDANTVTDKFLGAGIDGLARGVFGGFSVMAANPDSTARLMQYNATGVSEWSVSQSAAGDLLGDQFNDLFVAVDGTVWATGAVAGQAVTWSFDAAGVARWYGWNGVYDAVIADSGDALSVTGKVVYVAGRSGDSLVLMQYAR